MPWSAIAYVSSGATLVAFLAATAAWLLRLTVLQRERMIKAAPEGARAELVAQALEAFKINAEKLTKAQQYDLAVRQINERARRFRTAAALVAVLAVVAAGVSIPAILNAHPDNARQQTLGALSADLDTYLDRVRNFCEDIRLERVTPAVMQELVPKYNLARQTLMRTEEQHRQQIRMQWTSAAVRAYDRVYEQIFDAGGIDELVFTMNKASVDPLNAHQDPNYEILRIQQRKLAERALLLRASLMELYEELGADPHAERAFMLIDEIRRTDDGK